MIRPAKLSDDIYHLSKLIFYNIFTSYNPDFQDKTEEIWNLLFKSKQTRLSYENILVYEENNQVLGFICFYDKQMESILQDGQLQLLKDYNLELNIPKECFTDGIYIDAIVVDEKMRNKGIAKALINELMTLELDLSLIVEKDSYALNLYKKLGFEVISEITIFNHKYYQCIRKARK